MTDHPITPPPELVEQWAYALESQTDTAVFTQAARWGADQELEACISAVLSHPGFEQPELFVELLRAARRRKPPSLKKQALELIDSNSSYLDDAAMNIIRRALEQLDD